MQIKETPRSTVVDFRSFVVDWLERRGWSQARLADTSDCDRSLVSKYLALDDDRRVVPSPQSLERMAPVLGVPYEELMRMCGYLHGEARGLATSGVRFDVLARVQELLNLIERPTYPEWAAAWVAGMEFDQLIERAHGYATQTPSRPPRKRTRQRSPTVELLSV